MEQQKVDMFLMSNASKLPEGKMMFIHEYLARLEDSKSGLLATIQLKDPTTSLILSLLVGAFGADRFYLGQTTLGVVKLITCGGMGIWAIVDWFLIMNATKDRNFEKMQSVLF